LRTVLVLVAIVGNVFAGTEIVSIAASFGVAIAASTSATPHNTRPETSLVWHDFCKEQKTS
jgi:hypothetical protein